VLSLYEMRQDLEKYMDNIMNAVAPNVMSLVGSLLGARLIAIAGGLPNIARLPASTIQILGAEKALFRSLKTGTRPPKHGLIFQHTYLHDAKRWQRGKLARALAGKLAIAARADAYGGRDISKRLKEDLNRRVEEIREKYSEPPPIQERKPQSPREQMRRPQHGGNWRKRERQR
jgi:nucleolar protein 56